MSLISHGDICRTLALAIDALEVDPTPTRRAAGIELLHELEWRIVGDAIAHNIDLSQTEFVEEIWEQH